MKLSVSVPDRLWAAAKMATKEQSPSKLVQRGLLAIVGDYEPTDEELRAWWNAMRPWNGPYPAVVDQPQSEPNETSYLGAFSFRCETCKRVHFMEREAINCDHHINGSV